MVSFTSLVGSPQAFDLARLPTSRDVMQLLLFEKERLSYNSLDAAIGAVADILVPVFHHRGFSSILQRNVIR